MESRTDTEETHRLLTELDRAIDRSSVLRELLSRRERLRRLEGVIGSSRKTRVLRKEIELMETRLRLGNALPAT